MKNRILLTAALCMSMMGQITAQGYTSLREQIQLAGEGESSLGTWRLPGTTDENRLGERNRDTLVTYQLTRLYPYSGKVIYTIIYVSIFPLIRWMNIRLCCNMFAIRVWLNWKTKRHLPDVK